MYKLRITLVISLALFMLGLYGSGTFREPNQAHAAQAESANLQRVSVSPTSKNGAQEKG